MTNKKLRQNDGFTIIEVLIVLAIAGLIMLIVFLAVPALQRNARNTTRKSDTSSLASAVSEYVNNNDGQLPTQKACGATGGCFTQNWKPGFYTTGKVSYTYNGNAKGKAPKDPGDQAIVIETYLTCNGTTPTATNATARSVAVVYDVETGGAPMEQCITAN